MLDCKSSAKCSMAGRRGGRLTCSAQENCASGAKSVHALEAGLLGEAPGTGLEAGETRGLAAGVTRGLAAGMIWGLAAGLTGGLAAGVTWGVMEGVVGLVEGVVPEGQRLQVAAQ